MEIVDLSRTQLSGAVPAELGGLASLTFLSIEGNQLSGAVPAAMGGLTRLSHLALHDNRLSGRIPRALTQLSTLTLFYFGGNDGLCAPSDYAFLEWLKGIPTRSHVVCE